MHIDELMEESQLVLLSVERVDVGVGVGVARRD